MTIEQSLESQRPDIEVSLWLMERVWGPKEYDLSEEVLVAFRVEQILSAVNNEGFECAIDNMQGNIDDPIAALNVAGLQNTASVVREAFDLYQSEPRNTEQLDALSNEFIAQSANIIEALLKYVRQNIDAFKRFD